MGRSIVVGRLTDSVTTTWSMSDTPAPRGLAGMMMAVAQRLDDGDPAPALQKTQTVMLIALVLETCWPTLSSLL